MTGGATLDIGAVVDDGGAVEGEEVLVAASDGEDDEDDEDDDGVAGVREEVDAGVLLLLLEGMTGRDVGGEVDAVGGEDDAVEEPEEVLGVIAVKSAGDDEVLVAMEPASEGLDVGLVDEVVCPVASEVAGSVDEIASVAELEALAPVVDSVVIERFVVGDGSSDADAEVLDESTAEDETSSGASVALDDCCCSSDVDVAAVDDDGDADAAIDDEASIEGVPGDCKAETVMALVLLIPTLLLLASRLLADDALIMDVSLTSPGSCRICIAARPMCRPARATAAAVAVSRIVVLGEDVAGDKRMKGGSKIQ